MLLQMPNHPLWWLLEVLGDPGHAQWKPNGSDSEHSGSDSSEEEEPATVEQTPPGGRSLLYTAAHGPGPHTFSESRKLVGPQTHGHLCATYQVLGELLGTELECSPRAGAWSIMSPRQAVTDPGDRLRSHSMQQPQVIYFPPPGMGQGEHLQEGGTRC